MYCLIPNDLYNEETTKSSLFNRFYNSFYKDYKYNGEAGYILAIFCARAYLSLQLKIITFRSSPGFMVPVLYIIARDMVF